MEGRRGGMRLRSRPLSGWLSGISSSNRAGNDEEDEENVQLDISADLGDQLGETTEKKSSKLLGEDAAAEWGRRRRVKSHASKRVNKIFKHVFRRFKHVFRRRKNPIRRSAARACGVAGGAVNMKGVMGILKKWTRKARNQRYKLKRTMAKFLKTAKVDRRTQHHMMRESCKNMFFGSNTRRYTLEQERGYFRSNWAICRGLKDKKDFVVISTKLRPVVSENVRAAGAYRYCKGKKGHMENLLLAATKIKMWS